MAPSKKKKKAASNPARGFATTSTASKPKHDDSNGPEIKAESVVGNQHVDDQGSGSIISVHNVTESVPEKALHELSPEELEIQLETSNLQMLVESYGEKSKKDTARQTSRLQTERRLLRSQADRLSVHQWLPTEILQIIGALLEPQIPSKESFRAIPELSSVASNLSEDDLLNKLWTLKRLLPQLGFSEVNTRSALRHLLIKRKCFEAQTSVTNKDSVWGLDECLDWLALTCEAEDLPSFDFHDERSGRAFEYQRSGALAEAGKWNGMNICYSVW